MLRQEVRSVFRGPADVGLFLGIAAVFFWLLVMIPVWTTPGNDWRFQLSLIKPWLLIVMILLSLLNAQVVLLQLALRRRKASMTQGVGMVATSSGLFVSTLTATLACTSCYSTLLAWLGLGGAVFLAKYQVWVISVAFFLALIASAVLWRTLLRGCKTCGVGSCEV